MSSRRNELVFRAAALVCEALESRRLLTFVVNGTAAPDIIQMYGGSGLGLQRFVINGQQVGETGDDSILIAGLGGNDQVVLYYVDSGKNVTVRGGLGNDYVEVGTSASGNGSLFSNLRGNVHLQEFAGEGDDTLVANDGSDATPDRPVTIRDNLLAAGSGAGPGARFDDNVETKTLLGSQSADTVYVESPAFGINLALGGGDDYVEFGSITGNDLPDFMKPGTVASGTGNDRVVFDDSGQDDTGNLEYQVTATRFLNQTLIGVEHVELNPRAPNVGSESNTIVMTGVGGTTETVTVLPVLQTRVELGTEATPIDVDELDVSMDLGVESVTIYDQDANASNQPFLIYTAAGSRPQRMSKGTLNVSLLAGFNHLSIYGGTTNDTFGIGGTIAGTNIFIHGGAGNDLLHTVGLNGLDNDLDAVFLTNLGFHGGTGYDTLDLDDSGDQTGDGDATYFLGMASELTKDGERLLYFSGGSDGEETDHVRLVTDADPNTVYFGAPSGSGNHLDFTIDGGPGNDLITNYRQAINGGDLSFNTFDATIVGGAGNDTLAIDDTQRHTFGVAYHFRSDLSFASVSSIDYDASMENVSLDASDGGGTIRIDAKAPNTTLTVNGRGGNDAFTVGGGDVDSNGFSLNNVTVNGGTGVDSMRFDDRLDDHPDGSPESETYIHTALAGVNKLGKGTAGVNYSSCESLTIDTGNVATGFLPVDNVLKLNTFSSFIESITVNGGNIRSNDISVTTGNLANLLNVPVTLNLGAAPDDVVTLFDQGATVATTYQFRQTYFARNPGASQVLVNHTGVEYLKLSAGTGSDFISVEGIAAGTIVEAHGNAGDDRLNVEDGAAWEALDGLSFLFGDAGNDHAVFIANNTSAANATLTNSGMSVNGGPVQSYFDAGNMTASFGAGGTNLDITSMSTPCQVNFGNGSDQLTIGDGRFHENITRTVNVNFGFGSGQSISYDDRLDTGNDSYQMTAGDVFEKRLVGGAFSARVVGGFIGSGTTTILANNGDNQIALWSNLSDARVFAGAGDDTVSTYDGFTTIDTGPEGTNPAIADVVQVNVDHASVGDQPATVRMAATDRLSDLRVFVRGTALIPTGVALDITNSLALQGVIDMNGGAMIVRNAAAQVSVLKNLIKTGRNNGAWNGPSTGAGSINSSLAASTALVDAVGYAKASEISSTFPFTFAGQQVNANDALLRYTLDGNANLDTQVNLADFNRLASNFGQSNRDWVDGDFNYDGTVNLADFNALAANFGGATALGEPGGNVQGEVDDDDDEGAGGEALA